MILIFVFLQHFKDLFIDVSDFLKFFDVNKDNFYRCLKKFLRTYYFFRLDNYRIKLREYLNSYRTKINEYFNNNILDVNIIETSLDFFDNAIATGFPIIELSEKSRGDRIYFFPQYTALSLLYATLKSDETSTKIINIHRFREIFKNECSLNGNPISFNDLLSDRLNRLYPFVNINKILRDRPKIEFSRDDFINKLEIIIEKDNSYLEPKMILDLYNLTDESLTPIEFIKLLNFSYNSSLAHFFILIYYFTIIL